MKESKQRPERRLMAWLIGALSAVILLGGLVLWLPHVLPDAGERSHDLRLKASEAVNAAVAPVPEAMPTSPDTDSAIEDEIPSPTLPAVLEDVDGITVDLLPLNEYSRPGVPLDGVNAIVIHYTASPGSSAQQNRDYYATLAVTGAESVSSHFVIGIDGEIIQCVPLDEKSYCTNDRNHDTISIECCHPDETGAFTEQTRSSLVWLIRYLAEGYGLGEDEVIRHYDVTGKLCPLYYVEHEDEWIALKAEVFSDTE